MLLPGVIESLNKRVLHLTYFSAQIIYDSEKGIKNIHNLFLCTLIVIFLKNASTLRSFLSPIILSSLLPLTNIGNRIMTGLIMTLLNECFSSNLYNFLCDIFCCENPSTFFFISHKQ